MKIVYSGKTEGRPTMRLEKQEVDFQFILAKLVIYVIIQSVTFLEMN